MMSIHVSWDQSTLKRLDCHRKGTGSFLELQLQVRFKPLIQNFFFELQILCTMKIESGLNAIERRKEFDRIYLFIWKKTNNIFFNVTQIKVKDKGLKTKSNKRLNSAFSYLRAGNLRQLKPSMGNPVLWMGSGSFVDTNIFVAWCTTKKIYYTQPQYIICLQKVYVYNPPSKCSTVLSVNKSKKVSAWCISSNR